MGRIKIVADLSAVWRTEFLTGFDYLIVSNLDV